MLEPSNNKKDNAVVNIFVKSILVTGFYWLCLLPTVIASPIPSPPTLSSASYILLDFNTGKVLAEKDADVRRSPASLTKLMTAYVVYKELTEKNIALSDIVNISKKAWQTGGSRSFLEVNKKVPVEILLKGMIIQSGNDSSVALAEYIAGSEETFTDLMNHHAQQLGMTNSKFANASGLPADDHYSSSRDISMLARAIIREFPEFYSWYSLREFTYDNIRQYNRNTLLRRDRYVDGLKTGYTKKAGYCLAASAKRHGMRLVSVLLGGSGKDIRASETQALLNYGFRFYETHRLYRAAETVYSSKIWKGEKDHITLGIEQDFFVTIPRKQYKKLASSATLDATIVAPITKGAAIGVVNIKFRDEDIASIPLLALEDIPEGSLWGSMVDSVKLWFK